MATGEPSGFIVLDIDGDAGRQSLQKLHDELGPLPPGPVAETGGGGSHLFFQHPGHEIRNRIGILPGFDVIREGGAPGVIFVLFQALYSPDTPAATSWHKGC